MQTFAADAGQARLGKAKADETLCTVCHLGGFLGQNEIPRVAGTLSEDDIRNLAAYIVGL